MISSLELARLCGVSQGTVDRALHDRPGVAAATRAHILATASEYGYVPNPTARELMGKAASTLIGAVVPETASEGAFFATLLSALSRRLRQDGLRLVASYATDCADQEIAAGELTARRVRALLLVRSDEALTPPSAAAVPHLALVTALKTASVPSLVPDEYATGRTAAEYLLSKSHRHLLHCGPDKNSVSRNRRDGFLNTITAAGAQAQSVTDPEAAIIAVRSGVTAVFCHNDPVAAHLIAQFSEAGIRVGTDVAVIGVDGAGALPGLTTIRYPFEQVADGVAQWLADPTVPLTQPVGQLIAGSTG